MSIRARENQKKDDINKYPGGDWLIYIYIYREFFSCSEITVFRFVGNCDVIFFFNSVYITCSDPKYISIKSKQAKIKNQATCIV